MQEFFLCLRRTSVRLYERENCGQSLLTVVCCMLTKKSSLTYWTDRILKMIIAVSGQSSAICWSLWADSWKLKKSVAAANGIWAKETVDCITTLSEQNLLETLLCKDTKSRDMRKLKIENWKLKIIWQKTKDKRLKVCRNSFFV